MAITSTTELMAYLTGGGVLSGIQSIEFYDIDDTTGASKVEVQGDTLADTFSLTQDDPEINEIKAEDNSIIDEVVNMQAYKGTLTLAKWNDNILDFFNIKRVARTQNGKDEVGAAFVNMPLNIWRKLIVRFTDEPVYLELPKVKLRSKVQGENLRTQTLNAIVSFTAYDVDAADTKAPLFMWEEEVVVP